MKFFYVCALLLPIIVSAYPSPKSVLQLQLPALLAKLDGVKGLNADIDHIPDNSVIADGINEPSAASKMALPKVLPAFPKMVKFDGAVPINANANVNPDISIAADGINEPSAISKKVLPKMVKSDAAEPIKADADLIPDISVAADGINEISVASKKDLPVPAVTKIDGGLAVAVEGQEKTVPDMSVAADAVYTQLKLKELLEKMIH